MSPSPRAMNAVPMFGQAQKLAVAGARLQAHGFKAMMRYQIEMLDFLKHRFEQDVKLVDDLVSSSEFNDAFDVCSDFFQNAAIEYSEEMGKVASIGSKLASEAASRVRTETESVIEDMAAKTVA
ncbi:phasin family protein [Nitratireductor mangrovi]|uniref:Phasin family protein n=1 Tax=Nitratireductor mangrovi TaxID=2599600 RepID=A0A5B8L022_9HYPH|nr:phasin family protein [Nitratireductor mangrovi]QDZ01357.1 phasin family protein [Nitratireductor mangrovi]